MDSNARFFVSGERVIAIDPSYGSTTLVLWLATHCHRPSRNTKTSNMRNATSIVLPLLGPVIRFDPTSSSSDRFNLIDTIRPGQHEVRDVQNLTELSKSESADEETKSMYRELIRSLFELFTARSKESDSFSRFLNG